MSTGLASSWSWSRPASRFSEPSTIWMLGVASGQLSSNQFRVSRPVISVCAWIATRWPLSDSQESKSDYATSTNSLRLRVRKKVESRPASMAVMVAAAETDVMSSSPCVAACICAEVPLVSIASMS